jgi:hypothetical protein
MRCLNRVFTNLFSPSAIEYMTIRVCAFLLALFFLPVIVLVAQDGPPRYMSDNSDWWSQIRRDDSSQEIAVQKREPAASNFRILGIGLDKDLFIKATARLGKAPTIERGDGSTGRSQICYASMQDSEKAHLVFERGEVADSYYLFAGGPDWKGSDLCVKSNLVTKNLSAASGLRLGQTPSALKAILGKPSAVIRNKIVYSYGVEKKSSAGDFDKLRQQHPELNEKELRQNYEFYSLGVYIEARFVQSKMTYLLVSKIEAY